MQVWVRGIHLWRKNIITDRSSCSPHPTEQPYILWQDSSTCSLELTVISTPFIALTNQWVTDNTILQRKPSWAVFSITNTCWVVFAYWRCQIRTIYICHLMPSYLFFCCWCILLIREFTSLAVVQGAQLKQADQFAKHGRCSHTKPYSQPQISWLQSSSYLCV